MRKDDTKGFTFRIVSACNVCTSCIVSGYLLLGDFKATPHKDEAVEKIRKKWKIRV